MGVQRQSKREYLARMQGRYLQASKREKGRLLDEVVEVTGDHRRHALRVLRHGRFPDPKLAAVQGLAPGGDGGRPRQGGGRPPGRPRVYSSVVVGALRAAAAASGWLCGTRLAPFLPELVPALEAEGELRLRPAARAQRLAMSARTIARRLRPFRLQRDPRNWHGLGTTKPGTLLKDQVPIRTSTPWEDQRPGFLEIDLVAHSGTTTEGFYLNTLVGTDGATGRRGGRSASACGARASGRSSPAWSRAGRGGRCPCWAWTPTTAPSSSTTTWCAPAPRRS
jgi:hypothetical protein